MSLCTIYPNQTECAFALSNIYNIKLISLFLVLVIALYLWYVVSKKIDKDESFYHYFLYLITSYMPFIYVMLSPFYALILKHSVSFDMFVMILAGIYLVAFVLGFGLVAFFAKKKIYSMLSKENLDSLREMRKYKND